MWDLNNEGETQMGWGMPGNWTEYYKQYVQFYVDTITPIMKESGVDLTANYADTSPSNGVLSFEPYVKRHIIPTNVNYGDAHYYYLALDCEADETHPDFRFLSESGFQSEASFIDYVDVSLPSDWSY